MTTNFKMIAKTFKGLENVLATELINLGANDVEIQRRAVSFTGDKALMYKANLHLRTATRVLKPLFDFKATNPDEVYEEIKRFDWESVMNLNTTFSIDTTAYSDDFRHSKFVSYRVKDAIVDSFNEKYNQRPSVSLTNPALSINVHIAHSTCSVSLDSSGESLHKRGWRVAQTEAPINEVLAAGLLLMADWDGSRDLIDPMCGSGTILIEAAMIALGIPPGIYRSSFAFEKWHDFDGDLFDTLYNDDSIEKEFTHKIIGSDCSIRAVKIAEENIKSAGLNKYITVSPTPLQKIEEVRDNCLVISNPPYGERISSPDILKLYGDLGTCMKHKFINSDVWVISSADELLKHIGLKPARRIRLANGQLDCWYNKYEIFAGKRNDFIRNKKENAARPKLILKKRGE